MSEAPIADFGRQYVVRITGEGQTSEGATRKCHGTGFVIRRGIVATALHVVADLRSRPIRFYDLTLTFALPGPDNMVTPVRRVRGVKVRNWPEYNHNEDWALVSFDTSDDENWPVIGLRSLDTVGTPFYTHGFAEEEGGTLDGHIASCRKQRGNRFVIELYSKQAAAMVPAKVQGFSGGPVMVGRHAIGILTARSPSNSKEHPTAASGGTLYAIPISCVLDSDGNPICPDASVDADQREIIEREVLTLLKRSNKLRDAVLRAFQIDVDSKDETLLKLAAEHVRDTHKVKPLLTAAVNAIRKGADRSDVLTFLQQALRGCGEYIALATSLRADLLDSNVAILSFPVETLTQAEIVMAVRRHGPVAFSVKHGRLVGESHVGTSNFRPDVSDESRAQEGDVLFASVVCTLAREFDVYEVHPNDVLDFLQQVNQPPETWTPDTLRMSKRLEKMNRAIAERDAFRDVGFPPFYVAVPAEHKAGLAIIKRYLPALDAGVLNDTPDDVEYFANNVLKKLFTDE